MRKIDCTEQQQKYWDGYWDEYWKEVRKPEVLAEVKDKLQRFCDTLTEEELRVIDEEGLVTY